MSKYTLPKTIRLSEIIYSLLVGGLLAWLFKDAITPVLTGGIPFDEQSRLIQSALFAAYTVFFTGIVYTGFQLNHRVSDNSRLKPRAFLALLGGLTGGLLFLLIYGTGTLDVSRVDWLFNLGDNAQHYLGWVFYRNDPWTFPIGFTQSLAYPGGSCMCFTDSIPLLAIPFKLLRGLLPATFQYFGWWTLASFMLQGALAALILFEVTRNRTAAVIAPLFFCTADILLFRVFRYTPLSGQWIVLLALYLYFLNKRENRWNWLWPLVHVMAVLIQGYFFVMTFVIMCGAMLERVLWDKKWRSVVLNLVLSLASTALVMWLVGFFTDAVDMSDAGLGYFKANLNAFINPLVGWSRFFAPLPLAPETYPNVNYLGLGIIILFIAGVVSLLLNNNRQPKLELHTQAGLFFIIPVLVVFALSNVVTWNEHILFTYTLPDPLMRLWGVFRGTERMLWPVYYLVFVFAISRAAAWSRRGWVTAVILLTGFGIQYYEVAPLLNEFHAQYSQPEGKKTNLRSPFWEHAAARYDLVTILPLSLDNWARLTQYAADYGLNINYSYFARQSPLLEENTRRKEAAVYRGEFTPGELVIVKSEDTREAICERVGDEDLLAYIDREWVLAPGFYAESGGFDDFAITGTNSNCARLSFADFINKYRDKMLVFSVMTDTSAVVDVHTSAALRSMGMRADLRAQPGLSYTGILWNDRAIFERISESPVILRAERGNDYSGLVLPVDLEVSSAGRISGEEDAAIIINGRDYAYHKDGMNIAVVDPLTGMVVDTGLFTANE